MASQLTRFLPSPSTLVVSLVSSYVVGGPSALRRLTALQRVLALVAILNWRGWPLKWHYDLWGLVPWIHWRYRVSKGLMKTFSIGQSPFEASVLYKGSVTTDLGDWNQHMSNSSYGRIMDIVRMQGILEITGPAFGDERCWSPLAGTSYVFLKEIPMYSTFEVDMHIAAWDDKWCYWIGRFTTPGRKGQPRTVNTYTLSRGCFKIKGSGLSIPPSRVFSLSGLGPSLANWDRTVELRKKKESQEWLWWGGREVARRKSGNMGRSKGDESRLEMGWLEEGLDVYEEERIRRLEVIKTFGDPDKEEWKSL